MKLDRQYFWIPCGPNNMLFKNEAYTRRFVRDIRNSVSCRPPSHIMKIPLGEVNLFQKQKSEGCLDPSHQTIDESFHYMAI